MFINAFIKLANWPLFSSSKSSNSIQEVTVDNAGHVCQRKVHDGGTCLSNTYQTATVSVTSF